MKPEIVRDSRGDKGVVSSASPYASQAGLSILRKGGNAVDAAVATSLSLGVVAPAFSGIGGGGFMLIHLASSGEDFIIDYRETAPKAAGPDLFRVGDDGEVVDGENSFGHKAVGVPGSFAGLAMALERYGTMSLKVVAHDAIEYARNGFDVTSFLGYVISGNIDSAMDKFRTFPEGGKMMLKPDGAFYYAGEKLILEEMGNSIQTIADKGIEEFYRGSIGDHIANDMRENGGLISKEDLENYQPKIRKPLVGQYKGFDFVTMPPPSSGGLALIQALRILEDHDLKLTGSNTTDTIDLMSDVLGAVYPARQKVSDPEFVEVPTGELASASFIKGLRGKAATGEAVSDGNAREDSQTSHLSVIDADRNVVALTESLECFFGSGVVAPNTSIFLNDTMHDFDPAPGGVNSIQPGKRPMSSMTPTIFFQDDQPRLVLGSAAGPRIITAVLQVALNVLEHGMNIQDAIAAPRFHFQGGVEKIVRIENRLLQDVGRGLRNRGYHLDGKQDFDFYFGGVHGITAEGSKLHGGADPRRDGVAAGY